MRTAKPECSPNEESVVILHLKSVIQMRRVLLSSTVCDVNWSLALSQERAKSYHKE